MTVTQEMRKVLFERARTAKIGEVWENIKTGNRVVVEGHPGYDRVRIRHLSSNCRTTTKFCHYFADEYKPT